MKKTLLPLMATTVMLLLSACDGKNCICYQKENGVMTAQNTYADSETRCATLSTSYRTCVEDYEALDPSQMATDTKARKAK
jgi:hypothetical protein